MTNIAKTGVFPAKPKRVNLALQSARVRKYGMYIGDDPQDNQAAYLDPQWLATHLHVVGLTGSGKTRWLLWLFQLLSQSPENAVVLIDPKGELFRFARDWSISSGLTKRLVLFDPADERMVVGYNPLRPNGLPEIVHAKSVRESIGAAWGQADFRDTPQLARYLFLSLSIARLLQATLVEALQILKPNSPYRKAILPRIPDPYLREELMYLDSMSERRQEELTASTVARLEPFLLDPMIRRILTQQTRSLDIADVIAKRKILLINLAKYQPLRKEDLGLLGRMLINDVLVKVFERAKDHRPDRLSPVYLMIDEVQNVATSDLCQVLDEGRGLKLHCILAHQFLRQLMDEERSGYLYHSVMNDARTKVLFDLPVEDLEAFAKDVFIDRWSPWHVKDEITSLEAEPVEEERVIRTSANSRSQSRGLSKPMSVMDGESKAFSKGTTKGYSEGTQKTHGKVTTIGHSSTQSASEAETVMEGNSRAITDSTSHMSGYGESNSSMDAHGTGSAEADSSGQTYAWDPNQGPMVLPNMMTWSTQQMSGSSTSDTHAEGSSESEFESDGESYAESYAESTGSADTYSEAWAETESKSKSSIESQSENLSISKGLSKTATRSTNRAVTQGITPSIGEQESTSESETASPFMAYRTRRVVSSRTFLSMDEFLMLCVQKVKAQLKAHFVLKVPTKPAAFLRAPWVETPQITANTLKRALERIYDLNPFYSRPEDIDAEERARTDRMTRVLPAAPEFRPEDVWHTSSDQTPQPKRDAHRKKGEK